jgi:hypothetical protein
MHRSLPVAIPQRDPDVMTRITPITGETVFSLFPLSCSMHHCLFSRASLSAADYEKIILITIKI